MTDNEIIKALEGMINKYHSEFSAVVLNLINRQQAENKGLAEAIHNLTIEKDALFDKAEELKAEIERLKDCPKCVYEYDGEMTEYCVQGPCTKFTSIEKIKSEAYKEFAEKLQAFCKEIIANKWNEKVSPVSWSYAYDNFIDDIDNLLKELVGEEK